MKLCTPHWEKLKEAIRARGLWQFVATKGEQVAAKVQAEVERGPGASTFEPLLAANMAIFSNALGLAGMSLMANEEDGSERCPICFLQRWHDSECKESGCPTAVGGSKSFENWIDAAASDQLAEAKRLGLMGDG